MAKTEWKGGALLAPVPVVFVGSGDEKTGFNVCTVAWSGIINTKPARLYISLRPGRFSYEKIQKNGVFSVNMPHSHMVRALDYCGVKSGRDTDKLADCGIMVEAGRNTGAPIITDCPVSLECRVVSTTSQGSHDMITADIVAVYAEEELLDSNGKLRLEKAGLMCYAHGDYFALGKKIGYFGFSVKKKKKRYDKG